MGIPRSLESPAPQPLSESLMRDSVWNVRAGSQPFGVSAPHGKKSYLVPPIKYIVTQNHQKISCFK